MDNSKRIVDLREGIIKALPKFPNNRNTTDTLKNKSLSALLIDYINWQLRFVAQKKRKVTVNKKVSNDLRWKSNLSAINLFLNKVRKGEDLSPHLSFKAHDKGFTPMASARNATPDERWSDKDMILNVMGYYHFHIGVDEIRKGRIRRTDDVIFARVHRKSFIVVGIFNHSVFEDESPERARLFQIYEDDILKNAPAGSLIIASMISTSGHALQVVKAAGHYGKIIHQIENQIEDGTFFNDFYPDKNMQERRKIKLRWAFRCLDLLLCDDTNKKCYLFHEGPN